jgi:hypothetical protein
MICTPDLYYQEFKFQDADLRQWKHKWLKRLGMYHELKFDEKERTTPMKAEDFKWSDPDNNKVIEQQTADLEKIRSTLKVIEEANRKLQEDRKKLSNRLGKHDIGNLAENKPGLVEKIINKASNSAVRCMEIASGSPLTEEELNGSPNRECPSFWPSDTTAE